MEITKRIKEKAISIIENSKDTSIEIATSIAFETYRKIFIDELVKEIKQETSNKDNRRIKAINKVLNEIGLKYEDLLNTRQYLSWLKDKSKETKAYFEYIPNDGHTKHHIKYEWDNKGNITFLELNEE